MFSFVPRWRVCLAIMLVLTSNSLPVTSAEQDQTHSYDVLIYGATPAGIAAAVAAAKDDQRVVLIEPTSRIGGLVTNGLSHSDFHTLESFSGAFLDFSRRVETHYATQFGPDSTQVKDSFHGTHGEPKVNLLVFEKMLVEQPNVHVMTRTKLIDAKVLQNTKGKHLDSVTLATTDASPQRYAADVFIDATYEGDLLAAAGCEYRVGREAASEYDESLAPEKADDQLQAYNFRWTMTTDAENRVTPSEPKGYRRDDFIDVLPILDSGAIQQVFGYPPIRTLFKAHEPRLPNVKYDINDVSRAVVRLSLPHINLGWPDGDSETRSQIFDEHVRDQLGLLYFLQNDPAVPEKFRTEAQRWGWCRDEFLESNHQPEQLYVREARRMVGQYVFTQQDSEHAPSDARAKLHRDAIAMGDYGNNCHGTAHEGPRFGGKHTGEFYNPVPPYQIPYGVLLSRNIDNLMVPGAASSTHVGFCALRYEPIWMSLGQAAGHAAAIANNRNIPLTQVAIPELQDRLHRVGSATVYVSDVPNDSPDFIAVQWWGTTGGLHGLEPMPEKPGQRGKKLFSQYAEANVGHEVFLSRKLDAKLRERWLAHAHQLGLDVETVRSSTDIKTRGDFIRAAWKLARVD